jgi:hypothetical protein
MTDLDEIFTLWERFTLNKIPLSEVSTIVSKSSFSDCNELPNGYLAALATALEVNLDSEEIDQSELLIIIHILRRFKIQTGVKISIYSKCLKSILSSKIDVDEIVYSDFFNLLEQILDPIRNWRDVNFETDSVCQLNGSIGDFIKIVGDCLQGNIQVPEKAKIHIFNLFGVALSSNFNHLSNSLRSVINC